MKHRHPSIAPQRALTSEKSPSVLEIEKMEDGDVFRTYGSMRQIREERAEESPAFDYLMRMSPSALMRHRDTLQARLRSVERHSGQAASRYAFGLTKALMQVNAFIDDVTFGASDRRGIYENFED